MRYNRVRGNRMLVKRVFLDTRELSNHGKSRNVYEWHKIPFTQSSCITVKPEHNSAYSRLPLDERHKQNSHASSKVDNL